MTSHHGDDGLAVEAVVRRHDRTMWPLELAQFLAGDGIPDTSGLITAGGDDGLAVQDIGRST